MSQQHSRLRDLGIEIGHFKPGKNNAITDVPGVKVGHSTLILGKNVRTGVTAILPHNGNIFQEKVPAAIYVGNGFGKLTGISQIRELGNLETPIILTNTLSVPVAYHSLISYTMNQPGNENVKSVNPVVGETNDGFLNDIRGMHVKDKHVMEAINSAESGVVQQGNAGAGTGTSCFGYKGGIGTSSRVVSDGDKTYILGVLVQTNFGGSLEITGVQVGRVLQKAHLSDSLPGNDSGGSCMIIVATDAPLDARNLERLARRAIWGMAKTGTDGSNGSGDYVIAFSTVNRVPYKSDHGILYQEVLHNDFTNSLFDAVIEATEEAILNSLFQASDMTGFQGNSRKMLPIDEVLKILEQNKRISK